jgi:hypothetical protein
MNYRFLSSAIACVLALSPILPVRANSELMRSIKYVPVCNFTTQKDYDSFTNWDGGISTGNLLVIASDSKKLNDQKCYIYLTPGKYGKFVTVHKSELDPGKMLFRLSTEEEVSFALTNLSFLEITKNGVFRAKFEDTKKQ